MSVTFSGPEAVNLFGLIQLKSTLKLETVGLKASRGVSALAICRKRLGLKGANAAAMIPQVEALIEKAKAAVPPGGIS